jgi:phage terminase large subunit
VAVLAPERAVQAAATFAREPGTFVRQILGVEPDDWQLEALDALAAGKSVAVRSGHGVGKSALEAWAILWFLATRPNALVPCTAPTDDQLARILWPEISRWLQRSPLRDILEWRPTTVTYRGRASTWFAVARASNRPENLAGFHARHVLYVTDEASGIGDSLFQVVEGALTTEGALMLMCGNPTKATGYFVDAFGKNRAEWHCIHVSSEDSTRVSKAWVEREARMWGRDSDVFRVRVMGLPPKAEADTFISLDLAEKAAARTAVPAGPLEMGVDVARMGDSETVFVTRRGYAVLALEHYRKRDTQEVAGLAVALARRTMEEQAHPAIAIKVDDAGVGGGVTDALRAVAREDPRLTIVPCNFGGPGDDHYVNATGVMWGFLREAMRTDELAIPNDDDLIGQLTTRKYKVTPRGIQLETKDEMRKRKLPSPDRADALALAFYTPGAEALDADTRTLLQGARFY